jgi:hypothetical protein
VDDGQNPDRFDKLVWAIRWLAAEPAAALAVVDDPRIVPDEIALDLDWWLDVAVGHGLVKSPALEILTEIDETFTRMSGPENARHWTPEAVTSSKEWADQRDRARNALGLLGRDRADNDLGGHV